jgi:hypothetical protein
MQDKNVGLGQKNGVGAVTDAISFSYDFYRNSTKIGVRTEATYLIHGFNQTEFFFNFISDEAARTHLS